VVRRATLAAALIAVAGALAVLFLLPHRVELRVRGALAGHEIGDVEVQADYAPSTLWTGRLNRVVLEGVEYELDLGHRPPGLEDWSVTAACTSLTSLPVDRVELRDARITMVYGERRWSADADIELTSAGGHAAIAASATPAGGGELTIAVQCDRAAILRASLAVRARVRRLPLGAGDDSVTGEEVSLALDAAWIDDDLVAMSGAFGADAISGLGTTARDVAGELRLDGDAIAIEASSDSDLGRIAAAARVPASLSAALERPISWSADLTAAQLELREQDALHQYLARATGIDLTGRLGLDAHFERGPGVSRERVSVSLIDANAAGAGGTLRLRGVRGDLAFDRLSPLRLASEQTISWSSAAVAGHRLGAGTARLRSDDPDALALGVRVTGIDLATWLPAVSRGKVAGTGIVDGHIDLELRRAPEWSIHILGGVLQARGSGTLRARNRRVTAGLVRDLATATRTGDVVQQARLRVAAALTDFRYTALRADLYDTADLPDVRFTTRGAGGRIPQQLDLTVNLTGADDLLTPLLRGWLRRAPARKGT